MTITSIKRNFTPNQGPNIVSITTDAQLEQIVVTGWLGTQYPSIAIANNGPFTFQVNDVLLINYADQDAIAGLSQFFNIFPDFMSVNPIAPVYPNLQGIVAHAGGGQANATQLNIGFNVITVVATAADSAKLPDNVLGQTVVVRNNGANSANIYPSTGDQINALGANVPFALAAASTEVFYGMTQTNWYTVE